MANLSSLVEQANSLHVGITEDYKQRIQVTKSFFQATPSIRKMEGDNDQKSAIEEDAKTKYEGTWIEYSEPIDLKTKTWIEQKQEIPLKSKSWTE